MDSLFRVILYKLSFIAYILVLFTVFSIYSAKRDYFYKPFLLSIGGAFLVFCNIFINKFYLVLIGNGFLIGAAIWNSKLNKASMFGKTKSAV